MSGMDERKHSVLPSPHKWPPPLWKEVTVITAEFRCQGYVDVHGIWHRSTDGTPIENVIGWLPVR
jgi:hypothetical protein